MTTHAALSTLFPTAFTRTARVIFADAVRDHQDEVYGVALRILGDRDAARMGLEIAERNADADLRAKIERFRLMMDREIDAAALVAELLAS